MFWKQLKVKKLQQELELSDEYIKAGGVQALVKLYQVLAGGNSGRVNAAAQIIHDVLHTFHTPGILRLSEQFREYTSMEWFADWRQVTPEKLAKMISDKEVLHSVLWLGTFHPNGYFRERCVRYLAHDEEAIGYVILRLNDWVEQVREAAFSCLDEMIDVAQDEALLQALPYMDKVKKGRRRPNEVVIYFEGKLESRIQQMFQKSAGEFNIARISSYDFYLRKSLYPMLLSNHKLPRPAVDELLAREKSENGAALLLRLILANYDCTDEELDTYMHHKNSVVRRRAIEYKYAKQQNAWEGLEQFLLDTNKGVRELVCYILRRYTDIDIMQFYVEHLDSHKVHIAILGIGENGTRADAKYIYPYLETEQTAVLKNAIWTLGRLVGSDAENIYWKYLQDERITVAKSAYQAAKNSRTYYPADSLYQRVLSCEDKIRRRYYIHLLLQDSSWRIMPYLLMLYHDADEAVAKHVSSKIACRVYYAKVSRSEADRIRNILYDTQYGIPENLIEDIELDLKYVCQ